MPSIRRGLLIAADREDRRTELRPVQHQRPQGKAATRMTMRLLMPKIVGIRDRAEEARLRDHHALPASAMDAPFRASSAARVTMKGAMRVRAISKPSTSPTPGQPTTIGSSKCRQPAEGQRISGDHRAEPHHRTDGKVKPAEDDDKGLPDRHQTEEARGGDDVFDIGEMEESREKRALPPAPPGQARKWRRAPGSARPDCARSKLLRLAWARFGRGAHPPALCR